MKRKEIRAAIQQADARLTRDKATVYKNIIDSIFEVSDAERLNFYDTVLLYVFYGITPDFNTFSEQKRGQIVILFDLIKKQRIGFESTLKLDSCDKTPPEATPKASPEATPNQDISIKTKDKDLNIKTQDEDEDKGCSPSSSSSVFFIDNFLKCYEAKGLQGFFDGTLTPSQKDRIIELSSKIDDFAGIFWEEVKASDWLQGQDFGKVLHLAERVVDGEYRSHKKPDPPTYIPEVVAKYETQERQETSEDRLRNDFEAYMQAVKKGEKELDYKEIFELQPKYNCRIKEEWLSRWGFVCRDGAWLYEK